MDAGRDEDDGLAVPQRLLRFAGRAQRAGVGEPGVEAAQAIEPPQVLGARDHERHERGAERRLPELAVLQAGARLWEGPVVADRQGASPEAPGLARCGTARGTSADNARTPPARRAGAAARTTARRR